MTVKKKKSETRRHKTEISIKSYSRSKASKTQTINIDATVQKEITEDVFHEEEGVKRKGSVSTRQDSRTLRPKAHADSHMQAKALVSHSKTSFKPGVDVSTPKLMQLDGGRGRGRLND